MEKYIRPILFTTVFLTGAGVLIMEVSAVRMLAPYFGSSLYVLSSVLTVVLFALALGYYYGGKLSDRFPYHLPLYVLITLGGLSLLLMTVVASYTLPNTAVMMPLLLGPLMYSIVFFFLPAFLLGIDSPFVIKLLSQETTEAESGSVVGATFFWSTAGSISGSLLSGFFLIPTFGLIMTMTMTGIVIVALGIGGGLVLRTILRKRKNYDQRNELRMKPFILGVITLLIIVTYLLFTNPAYADSLYAKDGYYAHINIFDGSYFGQTVRFLKQDTNNSSAIYLESDELVYPYTQFSHVYKELFPEPKNFLMLAGGAYTIPRALNQAMPELEIDVVEIEPELFELAHTYFKLPITDKIQNHTMDSRSYLARTDRTYDYIFVDTFSSGHFVPPHLVTKEFLELMKARLSPNGIVVMNFIASRPVATERSLTGSFTKTVASVFSNFSIYTMRREIPEQPQNLMYVMRNGDESLELSASSSVRIKNRQVLLSTLKLDPNSLVSTSDIVFTDDHAPVETLLLKERFRF